jgi:antirestriction protein ArdC
MTDLAASSRASVYARITDQIIEAIERGVGALRMPWHHDGAPASRPINVLTQKPYRGVNVLALWASASAGGFDSGIWGTFKQFQSLGARVRKGERATLGVVWKPVTPSEADGAATSDAVKPRWFARGFSLFNAAQVDNYVPPVAPRLRDSARVSHADDFIAALGMRIFAGGDEAFYHPSTDTIHLPPFERFVDAEIAIAVTLHECAHATGAPHRLDRNLSGRFGSQAYAMEEAVAELTASFVLADLSIRHEPRPDHAAYLSTWLAVLKDDPSAIFTAASKAQAAADWMHAQQGRAKAAA